MPIIKDKKLIYIHIPKTGGTAITKLFAGTTSVSLRNGKLAPMMSLESDQVIDPGHHSWDFYKRKYSYSWFDYTKFAVVRNPLGRLISSYYYAKTKESWWHGDNKEGGLHPDYELLKDTSLDEFFDILVNRRDLLKHQSWSTQCSWICDGDKLMVDFIINFETLNEDFYKRFGIKLPLINQTSKPEVTLISDKWVDVVKEIYEVDYLNLGYERYIRRDSKL